MFKQKIQINQLDGSSKNDGATSIVNPFHISGKSDGEQVVLNNNTFQESIFKVKGSEK